MPPRNALTTSPRSMFNFSGRNPMYGYDFSGVNPPDDSQISTADQLRQAAEKLAPLTSEQTQVPELQPPTTLDPDALEKYHRGRQLAGIAQTFMGRVGPSIAGIRHGDLYGHVQNTPAWQAVQDQAAEGWEGEQLRVANANKLTNFVNEYAKMKSDAKNEAQRRSADLALELARAQAMRSYAPLMMMPKLLGLAKTGEQISRNKREYGEDVTPPWVDRIVNSFGHVFGDPTTTQTGQPVGDQQENTNVQQDTPPETSQATPPQPSPAVPVPGKPGLKYRRMAAQETQVDTSKQNSKTRAALAERTLTTPSTRDRKDYELLNRSLAPLNRMIQLANRDDLSTPYLHVGALGQNVVISTDPDKSAQLDKDRQVVADTLNVALQSRATDKTLQLAFGNLAHGWDNVASAKRVLPETLHHVGRVMQGIRGANPAWNFDTNTPITTSRRDEFLGTPTVPPPEGGVPPPMPEGPAIKEPDVNDLINEFEKRFGRKREKR